MKPYKAGLNGGKRWGKIGLFLIIALIILGGAGYIGVRNIYERGLQPVDSSADTSIVYTLESGATVPQIAEGLYEKKLISSVPVFTQYVRSNDLAEQFKAGTYSLKQSYDVPTIASIMVEGKVDVNLFTILPGARIELIRAQFIAEGFTEAEVDTALNPATYAGHAALVDLPAGSSLEGFLYPDSYFMVRGETRAQDIVGLSLDEMAEALTPDTRAGIAAQGLSVYQGIILASIVEREVADRDAEGKVSDNRAKAAQVFLKRLKNGIMLQSNATDEHPPEYDTYSITGLPPGPISNVTKTALQAVAEPAGTDFLYFVAGCDGITRFSSTNEQHETLKTQHGVAETTSCQ